LFCTAPRRAAGFVVLPACLLVLLHRAWYSSRPIVRRRLSPRTKPAGVKKTPARSAKKKSPSSKLRGELEIDMKFAEELHKSMNGKSSRTRKTPSKYDPGQNAARPQFASSAKKSANRRAR
jgi:hypothetical protein